MTRTTSRLLAAAALALVLLGGPGCPGGPKVEFALVLYNVNAEPDSKLIAAHYALARSIPDTHLCGIEVPVGHYASVDHLLGARRTIVEECLCELIPLAVRPQPCDTANIDAVRAQSKITHLVFTRGIPARLYGTPWPTDHHEPSFDFYLSHLIYRNDDIFAAGTTGAVTSDYLTPELDLQAATFQILSAPPLDPAQHRDLAYGRIEAIDLDRTLALIERTVAAEALGLGGNFLHEKDNASAAFFRDLTASHAPECTSYITHEPFLFGTPESSWPPSLCRAGTTNVKADGPDPTKTSDDPISGVIPGSLRSTIPQAVDVSVMIGTVPTPNSMSGFNNFGVVTNWRRSEAQCTPLCEDHATQAERDACTQASTDWFRELDTSCVGAGRGLIGHQVRSYPVQYYGFFPPDWDTYQVGSAEKVAPRVLSGGAWQDTVFTDDVYLHFGSSTAEAPDLAQCTLEDGSVEPCPERLAIRLEHTLDVDPPLPVVGTREILLRLHHRGAASPGGQLVVDLALDDGAAGVTKQAVLAMDAARDDWETSELSFVVSDAELASIAQLDLQFATTLDDGLVGYLDLDGLELVDAATGMQLLDVQTGSFSAPAQDRTHPGDWAATAIDRLGAIAWWGSSSHHLTLGWAFREEQRFNGAFFMGRTLGESLLLTGSGASGIIYGDPLYRPSAVRIHLPGWDFYGAPPGAVVTSADLPGAGTVLLNVLHGTANLATVSWSLASCPSVDRAACDAGGLWTERLTGAGARVDAPVDWTTFIDTGVAQEFTLRLRIWNAGEEQDELFNYAYFQFQP